MLNFGYEIDFLPVGNGDKSGDAIAIRYGYHGNYKIMVVDGGTKESGQNLVNHIKEHYRTTHVDYLVNTHPDADHASGLEVVLEQLSVGEVWIHRPWKYTELITQYFKDGRITDTSLESRLKHLLSHAYSLEKIAGQKGIPIYEPYAGSKIGAFHVLSPRKDWYLELIPLFNKTPEAKERALDAAQSQLSRQEVLVHEHWNLETLNEDGLTSYENESSVILYGQFDGRGILLTGDAGIQALDKASDYATQLGFNLLDIRFIQVPHHGSRRNVSPSILNRILGTKVNEGIHPNKTAFVSSSKDSKFHPRKAVVNAFIRRGVKVHATQGVIKTHSYNMPNRDGWTTSTPLAFYSQVEGN
jgi:beta-lactamase superfamily II metal-dependent hydrolase